MAAAAARDGVEGAEAVARVLRARDHYEAIGAHREAEFVELRRCYLRVSVKVHPDKCSHPDATRAFQRLAEAWAVLGDEAQRQRYDAELRAGRPFAEGRSDEHGRSQGAGLEEAFAAFAFASAACAAGGGGTVGDFAEVLFLAQGLAHMRETGQAPDARALAAGGFALSAGLRIVGATAHSVGFEGLGEAAERTASVVQCAGQVAAVGAVAAQLPQVQEALESSRSAAMDALESGRAVASERAQQLGAAVDGARTVVRERAQQLGAGEAVVQLGTALGGVASWAQRARERLAGSLAGEAGARAEPAAQLGACDRGAPPSAPPAPPAFRVGDVVRLMGLQAAADLNGRLGEVIGFDDATARYRVELSEESSADGAPAVKRVKAENIQLEGAQ